MRKCFIFLFYIYQHLIFTNFSSDLVCVFKYVQQLQLNLSACLWFSIQSIANSDRMMMVYLQKNRLEDPQNQVV